MEGAVVEDAVVMINAIIVRELSKRAIIGEGAIIAEGVVIDGTEKYKSSVTMKVVATDEDDKTFSHFLGNTVGHHDMFILWTSHRPVASHRLINTAWLTPIV